VLPLRSGLRAEPSTGTVIRAFHYPQKKNLIAFSRDLWQRTRQGGYPKTKKFNGTFAEWRWYRYVLVVPSFVAPRWLPRGKTLGHHKEAANEEYLACGSLSVLDELYRLSVSVRAI
jgi:hypothetical protein